MNWLGSRSEILFRDSLCNHSFKKNKIEGLSFPEVYRVSISILNLIQKKMFTVYFLTLMSQFDLSFWYWSILQSMFQRLKTASIRTKFSLRLQNLILKLYFIVYCTEHLQKILPVLLIFTNLLCITNCSSQVVVLYPPTRLFS